jgi:FAD synthetase
MSSEQSPRLKSAFEKLVEETVAFISECLDRYSLEEIAISFNGGKDCTVLLYLFALVLQQRKLHLSSTTSSHNNNNTETNNTSNTTDSIEANTGSLSSNNENSNSNINSNNINNNNNQSRDTKSYDLRRVKILYFEEVAEFPQMVHFAHTMRDYFELHQHWITIGCDQDFKTGLTQVMQHTKIRCIFMGQRQTDPHSSTLVKVQRSDVQLGYPEFVRINPLLEWSYHDIWQFLFENRCNYCPLYDQGYTSIGNRLNTKKNPALYDPKSDTFQPAYCLVDEANERLGRL